MVRINVLGPGLASENGREALGSKVLGLVDLDQLGLPVPEAVIFCPEKAMDLQHPQVAIFLEQIQKMQHRLGYPMFALRCGSKNNSGLLPESVLNLGLAECRAHPSSRYQHLVGGGHYNNVCENHAAAFFKFFDQQPAPSFSQMPFLAQIKTLLSLLLTYFRKEEETKFHRSIIVQRMVLGTVDHQSLTGMCYTRNPYTGEQMDYGHFIMNRQGLSLGGINAPEQLDLALMVTHNPQAYQTLKRACALLERHYQDIRSLEYTAEGSQLFLLQNTVGNRTYRLKPGDLDSN